MNDDHTTNYHYLTYTFLFKMVGRIYVLNLGVEVIYRKAFLTTFECHDWDQSTGTVLYCLLWISVWMWDLRSWSIPRQYGLFSMLYIPGFFFLPYKNVIILWHPARENSENLKDCACVVVQNSSFPLVHLNVVRNTSTVCRSPISPAEITIKTA